MAPWRRSSPPRTGHRPKSAHHLRTEGKPQEGTGMGWGRGVCGGPGSFAGSTRTGRSAKRTRQAGPGCDGANARVRTRGRRGVSGDGREDRGVGHAGVAGHEPPGFSPVDQCERFDVPSNQECASAVAGHPDGCPAVGAPRPRSPASRAARPRAPRRAQEVGHGVRPRGSNQGQQKSRDQGVDWTDKAARPGVRAPENQTRAAGDGRRTPGSRASEERRRQRRGGRAGRDERRGREGTLRAHEDARQCETARSSKRRNSTSEGIPVS